jgi:hypothetical protein
MASRSILLGVLAMSAALAWLSGVSLSARVDGASAVRSAHAQGARRCAPGPGATGAPRSVEEVVALINTLPKPVTVPCLVESLTPPLKVFAVRSTASLQFSMSDDDPRWFIFFEPLIISVTSAGPGSEVVEMSVVQPGNQLSLKAELRFPVDAPVSNALAYERIRTGVGTTCAHFCHQHEVRDWRIRHAEAFLSKAIQPSARYEVSLASVEKVRAACKTPADSLRCDLLHAVLVHGKAQRQGFPADMPVGF